MVRRSRRRRGFRQSSSRIISSFAVSVAIGASSATPAILGLPYDYPFRVSFVRITAATTDGKNGVIGFSVYNTSKGDLAVSRPTVVTNIPRTLNLRVPRSTDFMIYPQNQPIIKFITNAPTGGTVSFTITGTIGIIIDTTRPYNVNLKSPLKLLPDSDSDSSLPPDFIDCRATREAYLDTHP